MEEEDENVYVLVVGDDEVKEKCLADNLKTTEYESVNNALNQCASIKIEVDVKLEIESDDEEHGSDYIDYEFLEKCDTADKKIEDSISEHTEYLEDSDTYSRGSSPEASDEYEDHLKRNNYEGLPLEDVKYLVKIKKLIKSNKGPKKYLKRKGRSFVEELRQNYEELRHDELKLVHTVEQMMRDVTPPKPPKDFCLINGIMFECVECGHIGSTFNASTRHYNEKHGPRYLICFACGDDFRSSINLYKHEARCRAADAHVVLKARAGMVGSRGRGRPFLERARERPLHYPARDHTLIKNNKYSCQMCSALFTTKKNLEAHENMHRGERPYRCKSCFRAYTNLTALTRHAKMHSDINYECDHCGRSFKTKCAVKAHLNTHNPVSRLPCPECDRTYAHKAALKIHIHRDHRKLPPPCACDVCPKRYPKMSLLKEHMEKMHGLTIVTRKMFYKILPTMTDSEVEQSKQFTVEV